MDRQIPRGDRRVLQMGKGIERRVLRVNRLAPTSGQTITASGQTSTMYG